MAYSPPTGNAASFDFTASGYVPPAGNAASFSFSAGVAASSGAISSKTTLTGVGTSIAHGAGAIHGVATLKGASLDGSTGSIYGHAQLSGFATALKPGAGAIHGSASLSAQGAALIHASGIIAAQSMLAGRSQAGDRGSIIGLARVNGVGQAVRILTATGTIIARATLTGAGQGANALAQLLATRQFVMADLFTLTLARTGQTLNYTSLDRPLWYQGAYFDAFSLQISGLQFKKSVGLAVDEQSITISATRDILINGRPWFDEIANGLLDSAEIRRVRVFAADWHSTIVGSVILFDGIVSTIDSLTALQCQLKVKSYLSLLNQPMPRNAWQSSCLHTLFDAGCGLSRAAFQASGVVGAGSTVTTINWSGATPGYYWQGTVQFTSGPNAGLTRTIKLATGSQLMFHLPLPEMPLTGDTFYAWPGCDKTFTTCQNRFNNTVHNRSYPYIPAPTIAL